MNDEPTMNDGDHDASDGSPTADTTDSAQDERIRALLADLGSGPSGGAMPPEVAARLDATLARLIAERDSASRTTSHSEREHADIVPLRRRWLSRATAAAAAVVVLGAGGVAAASFGLLGGQGADSSSSEAGVANDRSTAKSLQGGSSPSTTPGPDSAADDPLASLPRVSVDSFASGVQKVLGNGAAPVTPNKQGAGASNGTDPDPRPGSRERAGQPASGSLGVLGCRGPRVTDTSVVQPVVIDDQLAVLVVRPEQGGSRLVEAWTCAGDRRLAATTLTP